MATSRLESAFRQLRRAVLIRDGAGLTDAQLLDLFIAQKDQAAFEALVRRHGPMVLKVCRRVVGNHHDAEDVFQATFLLLARKAFSLKSKDRVANWLHGVALRSSLNAKKLRAKTQVRERQMVGIPEPEAVKQGDWHSLQLLLDQELSRLGEIYRLPILLCDLEGKSIKATAQQLGWPQGTVAGRLARGRKLLAKRLARHGLAVTGGIVVLQNSASACVSPALVAATVKAAGAYAAGKSAATGLISANVAILIQGGLTTMFWTKLKIATAVLVVGSVFALGGSVLLNTPLVGQQIEGGGPGQEPSKKQVAQAGEKPAARKKEAASARMEHDKLRGTWKVIERNSDGKKQGTFPQVTETWWIGKDKIVVKLAEESKKSRQEMTYHFWGDSDDAAPAPNNINIIGEYINPEPHGPSRATSRGIFALEGDKLTLCLRERVLGERPTAIPASLSKEENLAIIVHFSESRAFPRRTRRDYKVNGKWSGEKKNGEKYGPNDVLERFSFSFVGDVMIVAFEEEQEVVFKLDSATSPKQIAVAYTSQNMERKRIYIYALYGDDLKICFQRGEKEGTPPDSFTTTKGSGRETLHSQAGEVRRGGSEFTSTPGKSRC